MLNFAVGVICRFVFLVAFCAHTGKIAPLYFKDVAAYLFDREGSAEGDDGN